MYEKAHEVVHQDRKFTAALKGIDLDEGSTNTEFEDIKRRAEARVLGVNEEEIELDGLINIIDEDED